LIFSLLLAVVLVVINLIVVLEAARQGDTEHLTAHLEAAGLRNLHFHLPRQLTTQ
jgi:hypothetical protein